MKAIVIREFGGPDVLRWEDVDTPTPALGEVLVAVHAVSVNRTLDLQVRQDGGNYGVTLPLVLGNDPSGPPNSLMTMAFNAVSRDQAATSSTRRAAISSGAVGASPASSALSTSCRQAWRCSAVLLPHS